MPSFDQTPDEPEPFGYKISWFALKTSDPAAVLEAIEGDAGQLGIRPCGCTFPRRFAKGRSVGFHIATGRRLGLRRKLFAALSRDH